MNEKAVKELTKKGCIVEKDAAEALTEDDMHRIKQLDSIPMYLSEKMLDSLRDDPQEGRAKMVQKAGGGTELETEQPEESAAEEDADTTAKAGTEKDTNTDTDASVDNDTDSDADADTSSDSGSDERPENTGAKYSESKAVTIKDQRRRKRVTTKVEVLDEADITRDEKDVPEFLQNYNDRYDRVKKLLLRRMEMKSAVSIQRLGHRDQGEEAAVIGMVNDKYSTKSGKWMVEIEDKTGQLKALVGEREGERIVPDEVVGLMGSMGDGIIFADSVVRPDLPIPQGVTTTEQKVKAAYISDIHLGSEDTLYDRFDRFSKWLNSSQASDIGYLVIPGDVVEGVGVYPGQQQELVVSDIYKQYEMFEEWVKKLPEDLQVIVGPGNHDMVRLAEPQPRLPERALPEITGYDNVHMVQNPQYVRLHAVESEGIMNLLYHGYSFDGHVDQIQELREKAYDEPHHVMIDLLKRRHLAPTFGTNLLAPEDADRLVIDRKPDIMASGHFHSYSCESYKGVTTICASTFQAQTDFQKRMGHVPDPGKVTVIDFKTRKTEVKQF